MTERTRQAPRRTVARRVLLSYALIMTAFALSAGFSVMALRSSAREANLMREGYLPLALSLRGLVANQDTWNTQLNHITTARNPADKRVWFETAIKVGRPKKFGEVRAKLSRAFLQQGDDAARQAGEELLDRLTAIEKFLAEDAEALDQLFVALDRDKSDEAERLRDLLVTRGFQGKKQLSELERTMERNLDSLLDEARARELTGIQLLVALVALTVLVGLLMVLYARRVLRPLALVTERAKAVAQGDLTPRPVLSSNDEIGDLSATFEGMVSAIARANEQLLASERLATIGKMAAHVTHEIRNPLSSIALNLELLDEELGAPNEEARALVRAITKEVDRLSALSTQYLSVAKRQELRLEDENIGDIVREACDFVRADMARNGVELRLSIQPDLPAVKADEAQLKQALFNLLRNAREAMDKAIDKARDKAGDRGQAHASAGTIEVRLERGAAGGVLITVEDEGAGIKPAARARLFEPFFSTKSHGTGLGLAITRQIVQAHGGSISCAAREQRGTRFSIHLPEAASGERVAGTSATPDELRVH